MAVDRDHRRQLIAQAAERHRRSQAGWPAARRASPASPSYVTAKRTAPAPRTSSRKRGTVAPVEYGATAGVPS